jgi:tRNA(fMet)-specific endonuclease VapC
VADRLILDTNLIITAERHHSDLREFIGNDDPAISVITATELLLGVEHAAPEHRDLMALNVESLFTGMTIELFTVSVARMHAYLYFYTQQVGHTRSALDLMIAATAGVTGGKLLTADAKARFDELPGVRVEVVKVS